jgi:anti-sigma B factor antagonist
MVKDEFDTRGCDGHMVVALSGELDVSGSADAASAIASRTAQARIVIVDLSALDFIDCSSLGALLRVQRIARQAAGDVQLAAAQAGVQRLLTLTGAGEVFSVDVSVEAAVASLGGSPERFAVPRPAVSAACPAATTPLLARSA